MQPSRWYADFLENAVTAIRQGPDRLPRRLSPRAFDELHTSLDAHETTRQWEEHFGWDRHGQRDQDHAEYSKNRENVRKGLDGEKLTGACAFRHSGWKNTRTSVSSALHRAFASKSSPYRFDACGSRVIVCRDKTCDGKYVLVGNYCRNRWCVPCGNARSAHLAECFKSALKNERSRFITLTIRSDGEPLADLVEHLYASFRRLQRSQFWKNTITGGVAFLETKFNHRKERWHPHLHLIVQGKFVPQKQLSEVWETVSGGSRIVDVRLIRSANEAINYVTKYATKPALATIKDHPELLIEAILALHGKRMMIRFGSFRKIDVSRKASIQDYVPIMTLRNLLDGVFRNRPTSLAIMSRLLQFQRRESQRPP